MTQREALEVFTTTMVRALLHTPDARATTTRRRRKAAAPTQADAPVQQSLGIGGPAPVPEFDSGVVSPPFTQAQFEHMERTLRGEVPADHYVPDDASEKPWMQS